MCRKKREPRQLGVWQVFNRATLVMGCGMVLVALLADTSLSTSVSQTAIVSQQ